MKENRDAIVATDFATFLLSEKQQRPLSSFASFRAHVRNPG